MKAIVLIILFGISIVGNSQSACENTSDFEEGKEWALYQFYPSDSAELNLPPKTIFYYQCDPSAYYLPRKEFEIYTELLSKDSIGIMQCQSDLWSPCYEQGYRFVVDSILQTKKIPKNYFRRKKKKAKRLARKRKK